MVKHRQHVGHHAALLLGCELIRHLTHNKHTHTHTHARARAHTHTHTHTFGHSMQVIPVDVTPHALSPYLLEPILCGNDPDTT
jgi:hypothetical protein